MKTERRSGKDQRSDISQNLSDVNRYQRYVVLCS